MTELPVNVLDGIIVIVLLLSALFAFTRGFVKEVLAIGGWIGAFFSALYLYEPVKPYVAMYLQPLSACSLPALWYFRS